MPDQMGTDKVGEDFKDCEVCPKMVVIPEGEFVMGSSPGEQGRTKDEEPPHLVTIRSFAISEYEITRGEYAHFREEGRSDSRQDDCFLWDERERKLKKETNKNWRNLFPEAQTDRDPATCVSWNDANAYVGWLSERTGKGYRLLTEAEWEYAARAGTVTARFWKADNDICKFANGADLTYLKAKPEFRGHLDVNCSDGYVYTAPVGSFSPNKFGIYDMLGNVWEWVQDCWHDSYEGAPSNGSAWATESESCSRVLRGGSWDGGPENIRSARRVGNDPEIGGNSQGFRVARTLD